MASEAARDLGSVSDFKMDRNINILLDFFSSESILLMLILFPFSETWSSIAAHAEIQFLLQVFL